MLKWVLSTAQPIFLLSLVHSFFYFLRILFHTFCFFKPVFPFSLIDDLTCYFIEKKEQSEDKLYLAKPNLSI